MLRWGDDVEVHALRRRGWSISAIARHTGRDRKTVRAYLDGERAPGVGKRAVDRLAPFGDYITARLVEDRHLWALTLFDELVGLGFGLSYQSLTRVIRARTLRPACAACVGATGRVNSVIPHPPGASSGNATARWVRSKTRGRSRWRRPFAWRAVSGAVQTGQLLSLDRIHRWARRVGRVEHAGDDHLGTRCRR